MVYNIHKVIIWGCTNKLALISKMFSDRPIFTYENDLIYIRKGLKISNLPIVANLVTLELHLKQCII